MWSLSSNLSATLEAKASMELSIFLSLLWQSVCCKHACLWAQIRWFFPNLMVHSRSQLPAFTSTLKQLEAARSEKEQSLLSERRILSYYILHYRHQLTTCQVSWSPRHSLQNPAWSNQAQIDSAGGGWVRMLMNTTLWSKIRLWSSERGSGSNDGTYWWRFSWNLKTIVAWAMSPDDPSSSGWVSIGSKSSIHQRYTVGRASQPRLGPYRDTSLGEPARLKDLLKSLRGPLSGPCRIPDGMVRDGPRSWVEPSSPVPFIVLTSTL